MKQRTSGRRRSEEGAVAIIVALCLTVLLVVAGLVIDFGIVRIDRQVDKSAADSATLAGLHALNGGDGTAHPYRGVCTAVRYLKENNERFADIDENVGWTTAEDVATASGCSDPTIRNQTCVPDTPSSWAKFSWTDPDAKLSVTIQSGYKLQGSTWSEDSLPASQDDLGDITEAKGCDQLSVVISQSREPGLGSLATSSDLQTAIRSVGRVEQRPGGSAPAMLLLKRTGCPVLESGSNSGGSFIHVLGAISSDGKTQAGSIHADSDALGGCSGGSNQNVFLGKASAGIVAYAAPLASDHSQPDPSKPGQISTVAAANGMASNFVRDALANVYGATVLNGSGGAKVEVTGRTQVTRKLVDDRYFVGVKAAYAGAAGIFNTITSNAVAVANGWVPLVAANQCKPTQAEVTAMVTAGTLTSTSKLYINCTNSNGFLGDGNALSIPAGQVLIPNFVKPGAALRLPNATKVYIKGDGSNGINLQGSSTFEMHYNGLLDGTGKCTSNRSPNKAVLFLKNGSVKESTNNNTVRLCNTTMFLMGGYDDGCVPGAAGTAPTALPCNAGTARGTGQFTQTGGNIDWTAPDAMDITTDSNGDPLPSAVTAWSDPDGPEDLALWTESGSSSSDTYNMNGSSTTIFHVRGVFMVPNAEPFSIGGGASMNLTNAQYIATTIALNGTNTNITMSVDPNSAVTLPKLDVVGLVR